MRITAMLTVSVLVTIPHDLTLASNLSTVNVSTEELWLLIGRGMTMAVVKNLMDKFPLLIIESDAEAKKANAVMDELMQLSKPSAPVIRYGRTLAMLIEQYERKQYPALFERIGTAAELVKGLTELHDLSQNDLCKIAGINKQNFSAYVAGHRGLPRLAGERLAKQFGLSVLDFEFYADDTKAPNTKPDKSAKTN